MPQHSDWLSYRVNIDVENIHEGMKETRGYNILCNVISFYWKNKYWKNKYTYICMRTHAHTHTP